MKLWYRRYYGVIEENEGNLQRGDRRTNVYVPNSRLGCFGHFHPSYPILVLCNVRIIFIHFTNYHFYSVNKFITGLKQDSSVRTSPHVRTAEHIDTIWLALPTERNEISLVKRFFPCRERNPHLTHTQHSHIHQWTRYRWPAPRWLHHHAITSLTLIGGCRRIRSPKPRAYISSAY